MLKGIFILALAFTGCFAESPSQGVFCGEMPNNIYECFGSPKVVNAPEMCKYHKSECDGMKCIFSESGWLDGDKVNKKNVSDYFDQFSKDHPAWFPAVNHLKAACLGDHDLPAQGVFINCPAYDIMHCILTSFIRNAAPSQWKTTSRCVYSRSFASACPVCPVACFAPQVPNGACNACLELPRSA